MRLVAFRKRLSKYENERRKESNIWIKLKKSKFKKEGIC